MICLRIKENYKLNLWQLNPNNNIPKRDNIGVSSLRKYSFIKKAIKKKSIYHTVKKYFDLSLSLMKYATGRGI